MRAIALGIMTATAFALSTHVVAQEAASEDSFKARFAAATQRTAAFAPTKEMEHVSAGPSNFVHPLDRVIAQRRINLRAFLHTGGELDDLPFIWSLSAWKWPVISAELAEEEPAVEAPTNSPPKAIAATVPK